MENSSSPDPLKAHVGYWLRFVSNHVSQAFAQKLESTGVSVAEWVVLSKLQIFGEAAPSAIAESIDMTRGAVTKIVDRLSSKGLVDRIGSVGDQRYQRVRLTAAGEALIPQLSELADTNDAEYFGHLTKREKRELIKTMQGVIRRYGLKTTPTN